jgi:cell division protein FtsI/penicillin-binding protein 2
MRSTTPLFAIVALLLIGGAARLAYIERTRGPELRSRAERQQRAVREIPARRGEILDTRGRVLAGTVREPSIFVDAQQIADPHFAAFSLGPLLGQDSAELEAQLLDWQRTNDRFVWLCRKIDAETAAKVRSTLSARQIAGIEIRPEPVRVYPHGAVAPHVIGFVGIDNQGLTGIEAEFDTVLRGTAGRWAATVDVGRRKVVRTRDDEFRPASDGASIVLTIDAYLQEKVQEIVRRAYEKHAPDWAVGVLVDPQSGEVLAMACCPDFDPASPLPAGYNRMSAAERVKASELWRNRAISDAYEPGSVFKPFVASQALEDGLVRLDEVFAINGPVRNFGRRSIHDTHTYGALALHEIISKSSNIGMGMVGARCGMDRLYRYVRNLGFGDVTGIELPGEHDGLLKDRKDWNPSFSPQSVPIGQEISVTPIQIVTAFSTFCNGGVLLRPRIVRGIIGCDGETIADYSRPLPVRRVLSEQTVTDFRLQALVETVTSGTGDQARLKEWQVFGKTGTAQIAGHGGYGKGYVGSFVAGAPSDHPRVVALVSIYRPTKAGYYGGVVAAPSVKEILAEALNYLEVPAELHEEEPPVGRGARRSPAAVVHKPGEGTDNDNHGD